MAYVDFDGCEPILSQHLSQLVTVSTYTKNNDRLILSNYTILSFFDIVEKSNRNSKNKQPKVKAIFDLEFAFESFSISRTILKSLEFRQNWPFSNFSPFLSKLANSVEVSHFCRNWPFFPKNNFASGSLKIGFWLETRLSAKLRVVLVYKVYHIIIQCYTSITFWIRLNFT